MSEHSTLSIDIFSSGSQSQLEIPLVTSNISAGFPSPALDFMELKIDLNKLIIKHPSATFYGRVKGYSMKDAGIGDGDLIVIDKSITPVSGKIAVCYIDGEFTLKQIKVIGKELWLIPANQDYKPIRIEEFNNFLIWGIVTHVIKQV